VVPHRLSGLVRRWHGGARPLVMLMLLLTIGSIVGGPSRLARAETALGSSASRYAYDTLTASTTPTAQLGAVALIGRPSPWTASRSSTSSFASSLATKAGEGAARSTFLASDGTEIVGFTRHGINRAIGDGAKRAGVRPAALLDAIKNPTRITEGVDDLGRPFKVCPNSPNASRRSGSTPTTTSQRRARCSKG
jgi:hypothetical protein